MRILGCGISSAVNGDIFDEVENSIVSFHSPRSPGLEEFGFTELDLLDLMISGFPNSQGLVSIEGLGEGEAYLPGEQGW